MRHQYGPARLSIARSLLIREKPPHDPLSGEEPGRSSIRGNPLLGDNVESIGAWVALLVEHAGTSLTLREIQAAVGAHWHRGAHLLWQEWQACDEDFDRFVMSLCERAELRSDVWSSGWPVDPADDPYAKSGDEAAPAPVALCLGTQANGDEEVAWTLNAPGVSPHVAAMGTLGTGKTRKAIELLRQMREQSGCAVLAFDFKGDLADNAELVAALGAEVIRPPRQPVPLDVLHVDPDDPQAINAAAMRFRESFKRVCQSKPGAVQLQDLTEAVGGALASGKRGLDDLRRALAGLYEEKGRKDDTLTATFADMCGFRLFEPRLPPEAFFRRSWIVDVHDAPETAQRLVAFLLFDALNAWLLGLKDAPLDLGGHRLLRHVLMVDEARLVLGYDQPSLIEIVRKARSKGGAAVLVSQSPDDFAQDSEDFIANIGLLFSFRTNAKQTALQRAFGERVDLGGLENGVCVTRLPDRRRPVRVKAWD